MSEILNKNIIIEDQDFEFWTPIEEIEKAELDKPDYNNMVLKGIASTEDLDLDNEQMLTSGLDISYLNSNGIVNWHHQSKTLPSAVIGEPIEAKIVDKPVKGLFIKAKLYDTPISRDAYDLARTLQKQSTTRRLGWSVEGKIVEKDKNGVVHKAKITGVALTHAPKNNHTFAELCKAMVDGSTTEQLLNKARDINDNKIIIETAGGIFNINKEGNLHFVEKAISMASDGILAREDLEGGRKLQHPPKVKILNRVLITHPEISFEKALRITDRVLKRLKAK